jgi:nucleoid-associated protein YgaU
VPRVGAQPPCDPGVSEQRATGPRVSAERVTVQRASVQRSRVPGAGVPGASVQRVRVQRASARRVRVQGASMQPGELRLTRRGRRVLTGFAMLVAVIGAMLIWTSVAGGAQAPRVGPPARSAYQGMTQVVVRPGQTLWSVAAAADPSADPWTVIQQISDANALNGSQIQAGQLLWVPKG